MTREEWLEAAAVRTAKLTGLDVPPLHVSVGFPRGARGRKVVGQCFAATLSADGRPHIFVSPEVADPVKVLGILLHEQIHAAVGPGVGHRGPFVRAMRAAGMRSPWTDSIPGPQLLAKLQDTLREVGPYPHAALVPRDKKKKGSRLRLWVCACPVRVRVASDDFEATCDVCGESFKQPEE